MEARHPRHETQEERDEAYRQLRKFVRRTVLRYGVDYPDDEMTARVVSMTAEDGQRIDLTRTCGTKTLLGQVDELEVAVMHDDNVFGRRTSYTSHGEGPFTRSDINGEDIVAGFHQRSTTTPLGAVLGIMAGDLIALEQHKNIKEGIDGHPISAGETNEILERLVRAEVDRRPERY